MIIYIYIIYLYGGKILFQIWGVSSAGGSFGDGCLAHPITSLGPRAQQRDVGHMGRS